jgi:hypothetical protein
MGGGALFFCAPEEKHRRHCLLVMTGARKGIRSSDMLAGCERVNELSHACRLLLVHVGPIPLVLVRAPKFKVKLPTLPSTVSTPRSRASVLSPSCTYLPVTYSIPWT